jgi:hypothetical protein
VTYLDPAWLRREYLTWHRSLDDIADQIGCPLQTLNRFARDHGIPVRSRGTSIYIPAGSAPGIHPRDLPEPLRSALVERRARRRLDHLLISAGHASIRQAAQALGLWPSALYDQLGRTERACGGPLVNCSPRATGHRDPDPARRAAMPTGPRLPAAARTRPGRAAARQPRPQSAGHAWLSLTLASRATARARARWQRRPGSRATR